MLQLEQAILIKCLSTFTPEAGEADVESSNGDDTGCAVFLMTTKLAPMAMVFPAVVEIFAAN